MKGACDRPDRSVFDVSDSRLMRKVRMKKSWIALFIVFVAIVAVAAQVAAQAATPELSGNIRVGSWESGDALTYWNNAITGYEAAHPNVKVTLEAIPQDYGTKLLAEFAAGTAPDVFMV